MKKKTNSFQKLFARYKHHDGPRGNPTQWSKLAARVVGHLDENELLSRLGLESLPTAAALKNAYRKTIKQYHPDRGGSHEEAQLINDAYRQLLSLLEPSPKLNAAPQPDPDPDLPQLLNAIDDPTPYILDDAWLAQEKMDGHRRRYKYGQGLNRKNQVVDTASTIAAVLGDDLFLDAEIVGDRLYVFDLLAVGDQCLKNTPCDARIARLEAMDFDSEYVYTVPAARTTAEKQALFEYLKRNNKEGIVFKRKDAPYTSGRPGIGGDQLKFKFYKTATFIVGEHTKGKSSVSLLLLDGAERVYVGKVTVPASRGLPPVGSLVEVRYLYAYRGGCVYQPVYLGLRDDLDEEDCKLSQLVYKS